MVSAHSPHKPTGRLPALSAQLSGAETIETAVARATSLAELVFGRAQVGIYEYDAMNGTVTTIGSASTASTRANSDSAQIPDSVVKRLGQCEQGVSSDELPKATFDTDLQGPFQAEVLASVGRDRMLHIGVLEPGEIGETEIRAADGIAASLDNALARIDDTGSGSVDDVHQEVTLSTLDDGGLTCANRDITDRIRREEGLRDLKERLGLAIEGTELGVRDWDMETDDVIFNERWAAMFGRSLDETEPTLATWEQRVHPADVARPRSGLVAGIPSSW